MVRAIFWATFLQKHLVTLQVTNNASAVVRQTDFSK
jgi:hypothetical protein